jgi:DNA replication initiation complex subunit (GINS family)
LRRYLAELKEQAQKQSEKYQEYDRAKQLARDIVNSRLKKIVAISSAPTQSEQVLKKFTNEERIISNQLVKIISEWKNNILENGEK